MREGTAITDDAIAGATAGFVSRFLSAPFDVLKIRFQLQFGDKKYTSIPSALVRIAKEEGFFSLWKGNLSASYLWVSYMAVQFTVYGAIKRWVDEDHTSTSTGTQIKHSDPVEKSPPTELSTKSDLKKSTTGRSATLFFAGAAAGSMAAFATYPFDIMRTQFVVQGENKVYPTIMSFVRHTMATRGVKGSSRL